MQSPIFGRLAVLAALYLLTAGHDTAHATPLANQFSAQPANDAGPVRPLSEMEIVGTGTLRPEDGILSPHTAESFVQPYLKGTSGEASGQGTRDSAGGFDLGTNVGSPFEIFRSLVNVPQGNARNAAPRKGAPSDDGLTLGPEAREWIDDTVRGIVNSVVELRTNEQGRTTFSVLGMGDLGIMMSGDRNEVALVTGDDDVLLTAHRRPFPPSAQGPGSGFRDTNAAAYLPGGSAGTSGDYLLQRWLETVRETATHPLSMLVYAIVIAFVALWSILNTQANRRSAPHARGSHSETVRTPSRRSSGKHRARRSRRS